MQCLLVTLHTSCLYFGSCCIIYSIVLMRLESAVLCAAQTRPTRSLSGGCALLSVLQRAALVTHNKNTMCAISGRPHQNYGARALFCFATCSLRRISVQTRPNFELKLHVHVCEKIYPAAWLCAKFSAAAALWVSRFSESHLEL